MRTHNICLYKKVNKKYTGCNLKTTEFNECALIGVCAVIRSNTVCWCGEYRSKPYRVFYSTHERPKAGKWKTILFMFLMINLEQCSDKMVLFACAVNKGPDQPAYLCSISRLLLYVHVSSISITYIAKILKKKIKQYHTSEMT